MSTRTNSLCNEETTLKKQPSSGSSDEQSSPDQFEFGTSSSVILTNATPPHKVSKRFTFSSNENLEKEAKTTTSIVLDETYQAPRINLSEVNSDS